MRKRTIIIKYAILVLIMALILLAALNILASRSISQIAPIKELEFQSQSKLGGLEVSEELGEKYKQDTQAYEALAVELKKSVLKMRELQKTINPELL
ncbi:MAG: hypothetical protein ABII88_04445 [Candidatus Omnitrophota bacterium]